MKNTLLKIYLFLPLLLLPLSTFAAEEKVGLVTCQSDCTFCDIILTSKNIIDFLTRITFILVVAMVVYGGISIMIAGGDEGKIKTARKVITNAVYGILIVLLAWVVLTELLSILSGGGLANPWYEIEC